MVVSSVASTQVIDLTGSDGDSEVLQSIEHDPTPDQISRLLSHSGRRDHAAARPLPSSQRPSQAQRQPQPQAQSQAQFQAQDRPQDHIQAQLQSQTRARQKPDTSPYTYITTAPTITPAPLIASRTLNRTAPGPVLIQQPLDVQLIIKPISSTSVLPRTAYDPNTIARDVLIAADLHPLRRGLNFNLRLMKEHFVQVDDRSDLSTFRWDIVDPGGPPFRLLNMPPTFGIGAATSTTMTQNSPPSIPDNASASDSSYRSPQKTPLNPIPHRPGLSADTMVPNSGSPIQILVPSLSPAKAAEYPRLESPELDIRENFRVPPSASKPIPSQLASPSVSGHTPLAALKKRGRQSSKPLSSSRLTPLTKAQHTSTASQTIKKRGRPFANGHSPTEASHKGKGPSKTIIPDLQVPDPKFTPFLCEWSGCPAELQNLNTLRVHLLSVHGKPLSTGSIPCLWGNCGSKHDENETKRSANGMRFLAFHSKEEWERHVEKAHLIPIAWHLGDGPRGSSTETSSVALSFPSPTTQPWLFDSSGKQVTPSVAYQATEGGRARDNNARRLAQEQKGIYVIVEPPRNPHEYVKVIVDSDEDDEDELG